MRAIVTTILLLLADLLLQPAAASDRTSRAIQKAPFLLNFWRPQPAPIPAPSRANRGRAHANTSCLPPALKGALTQIRARFGPVTVVSTHRPGARIRSGRPSLHASCRAVDFRPARGTYGKVAAHLRRTWNGGIGTYSSGHIHIDTGPSYRWHSGGRRGKRR